ncbi:hypothetical protein E5082_22150 [Streptomyces griseoluteus]|uniref:Transposase IS4-like domain-containing protein n=1 Tax=Streptomyces griseoluteus TaxID=29306 RepID=A0A4Z1DB03_STRGP|nr:hypothetical protein E5082_22150 [Streptomyces griseoluteus]GHE94568.1 hypothetical protein GCM10017776_08480 [Streptomyces griseoluteus]
MPPLLGRIPRVAGPGGRPCQRPDALLTDRGYDHHEYRRLVRALGITPVIAERGEDQSSGLDVFRWGVERTIASIFGTTSR